MTQAAKARRAKRQHDKAVVIAACNGVRKSQKAARRFKNIFWIRKAKGAGLERMGELMGEPRQGRPDHKYRRVLAAIMRRKSSPEILERLNQEA